MEKKNKNMIWILALLAGGGAYWYYTKNKNAAAAAATLPAPGVSLPVTSAPPLTATPLQIAPTTMQMPVTTSTAPVPAAAGISADQLATLQQWAEGSMNSGNLNQWNAMKGSFTAQDWAGLADLYFNDWVGGQGNTPARTAFWDGWRVKYHIVDGTY